MWPTPGSWCKRSYANTSGEYLERYLAPSAFGEQPRPTLVDIGDVRARFGIRRNAPVIADGPGAGIIRGQREGVGIAGNVCITREIGRQNMRGSGDRRARIERVDAVELCGRSGELGDAVGPGRRD